MRNQLLSFVVEDLILQFMELRQSACVTVQAATDGNEDGFFSDVEYLWWCHKHSAPTIVLDVWALLPAPKAFKDVLWNIQWECLRKENANGGPGASEVKLEKALP